MLDEARLIVVANHLVIFKDRLQRCTKRHRFVSHLLTRVSDSTIVTLGTG